MSLAAGIIEKMFRHDAFSQWLGIRILDQQEGQCKLQMTIREEMCNGFGIAHGGITYSLADSALGFAANSHGQHALSIETAISHLAPLKTGETIIAKAIEKSLSPSIGVYEVSIETTAGKLVALFKGTVYRKKEFWHL